MRFVGWFEVISGLAIAGLWGVLLATGHALELTEGRLDIAFQLGADLFTALLLVAAGIAVLRVRGKFAAVSATLAAGALLYTTVNSARYYAELGQWPAVATFTAPAATLTAATVPARATTHDGTRHRVATTTGIRRPMWQR